MVIGSAASDHSAKLGFPAMPFSNHFDAVIFDMDGTLLDTESVFRTIVFDVCAELGYEMTDAIQLAMIGSSHEATRNLLLNSFGANFPYLRFDELCHVHMDRFTSDKPVPLKRGAAELITSLASLSIPIAIATSSRRAHAQSHLEAVGIWAAFDTIVTRDDVTNPKPHPEPYLTAAERLKALPPNCVAFEDSMSGVRAAHAAGMRTIMVPDLVRPADDVVALCHAVIESLELAHHSLGQSRRSATGSQ